MEPTVKAIARHPIGAILVVVFSLALASCGGDQYELTQDKRGRTIRLDKRTGEVAVVAGDRLNVLKTPEQVEADEAVVREQAKALGSPKTWPPKDFKQIGVTNATLKTVWKDGRLRYQLQLFPAPKNYENYDKNKSTLFSTLKFYDGSGFEVISVDLNRSDLVGIVDEKGDWVGLYANTSTSCSQSDYQALARWHLFWLLSP